MDYITRIRNLREDNDKTQQQIADILGTSQTMYARYERGANEMPVRHLIRLAEYYDVSLDYLCGLTDNRSLGFPGKQKRCRGRE
ncbi:MAG: helix-turn-helix domain-containing protein [Lachnospiraceae bacterium]|nr:helix-turn-helix domain-containing protein [Lachnospiraceae bacterium]